MADNESVPSMIEEFESAMVLAQSKMKDVIATNKNENYRSKYADINAILEMARPIWTECGLYVAFREDEEFDREGWTKLVCIVTHRNGVYKEYTLKVPYDSTSVKGTVVKTGVQALGSATTYGQRYLIRMVFAIGVEKDDDGNAAGTMPKRRAKETASDLQNQVRALMVDAKIDNDTFFEGISKHFNRSITSVDDFQDKELKMVIGMLNRKING